MTLKTLTKCGENNLNFIYACKDCWWMPNDQLSLRWSCLFCLSKRKKVVIAEELLWERVDYFYQIRDLLWNDLWNVIRTIWADWVLFRNKYATVWGMSGAFRWVKGGVWRTLINKLYGWAYEMQISWNPIPFEYASTMLIEKYDPGNNYRTCRNRTRLFKKKTDTRVEERKLISQLYLFICNYWKCVESMESDDWHEERMLALMEISSKWDISIEDIKSIKNDNDWDYRKIKKILDCCQEKKYSTAYENRRTKKRAIFNLPSELTYDGSQGEKPHAD